MHSAKNSSYIQNQPKKEVTPSKKININDISSQNLAINRTSLSSFNNINTFKMKMNNFKDNEFSLRYCLFNKINGCKKKQIKSREKSARSNSCAIQA